MIKVAQAKNRSIVRKGLKEREWVLCEWENNWHLVTVYVTRPRLTTPSPEPRAVLCAHNAKRLRLCDCVRFAYNSNAC